MVDSEKAKSVQINPGRLLWSGEHWINGLQSPKGDYKLNLTRRIEMCSVNRCSCGTFSPRQSRVRSFVFCSERRLGLAD